MATAGANAAAIKTVAIVFFIPTPSVHQHILELRTNMSLIRILLGGGFISTIFGAFYPVLMGHVFFMQQL
jgi:hypothetical protein